MTQQVANSSSINNSVRCAHRFPNSKRCRLYVTALDSSYCSTHAQLPQNQQDFPETAAVLAYITNQLLHTLPAIDRELNPKPGKDEPVEIIFDMPGPDRDRDPDNGPQPELTYADLRT
jgi:hypothetical protein